MWLIVDVGTNGELLLGNQTRVFSASSPTGPAFEGAQIRHGMRAAPGAIERIRIEPGSLDVSFKIIGRQAWSAEWPAQEARRSLRAQKNGQEAAGRSLRAAGICGSGTIEAVAELLMAGVIAPDGRFGEGIEHPRLRWAGEKRSGKTEFVIAWEDETSTGRPIVVTSDDVRAIQLAKAALYSGARLLMERFGADHVDRVLLAGAFGSYIDPVHAMVLGMIPDCPLERVTAVGNSAGDGARMALLSEPLRQEARRLARWVSYVGIALEPRFQEAFVEAIPVPHAVDAFPHLSEILARAAAERAARGIPDVITARQRRLVRPRPATIEVSD